MTKVTRGTDDIRNERRVDSEHSRPDGVGRRYISAARSHQTNGDLIMPRSIHRDTKKQRFGDRTNAKGVGAKRDVRRVGAVDKTKTKGKKKDGQTFAEKHHITLLTNKTLELEGMAAIRRGTIRRLFQKGGILHVARNAHLPFRTVLYAFLRILVGKSQLFAANMGRKTITPEDVADALNDLGKQFYGKASGTKRR